MAGHSKFNNIKHRKGAQDAKRAKMFTKLVREILTAAQMGAPDPHANPRLRGAITAARAQNLPRERIDKAISQASDPGNQDNYVEMRYEGFAPGGVAIIVEALTDNKNRTASDVRSSFTKFGGNLGETGVVSFMFDHLGFIQYPASIASNDMVLEAAIEAGAHDVESDEENHVIYTDIEAFSEALDFLTEKYGAPEESYIGWKPQNTVVIDDKDRAEKLLKMIDMLEDSDDVQRVFGNYELSDEIYKAMS
jgi:YebC/PmpR family DNA-binding regulatory protein